VLTPSQTVTARRVLPGLIEEAASALALAADLSMSDPDGALAHLVNAADAALRARAIVLRKPLRFQ
jgi:hypothetical protein